MENVSEVERNFARLWIDVETPLLSEGVGREQERQGRQDQVNVVFH
jgi:hypothetical protein